MKIAGVEATAIRIDTFFEYQRRGGTRRSLYQSPWSTPVNAIKTIFAVANLYTELKSSDTHITYVISNELLASFSVISVLIGSAQGRCKSRHKNSERRC